MNINDLFKAAWVNYWNTHKLPPPGRHATARMVRAKHRIAARKAKRKAA